MDILSDVKIFGKFSSTGNVSTGGNFYFSKNNAELWGTEICIMANVEFTGTTTFDCGIISNPIIIPDNESQFNGRIEYFNPNTMIICGLVEGPCFGCFGLKSDGLHSKTFLSAVNGMLMRDIGDTFRPVINEKTIIVPENCKSFVIGMIPRNKPPMITSYVKNGCSGSYTFQKVEMDVLARETEIIGTRDSTDEQTYTFIFGSRTF